ncbi:MAG: hypothetical protein CVT99_00790 [Bacteroidetes bacterium HGW-Bacteroidetes-16]|jgi:PAS domain S-box-containing protein|nr:MAG: hypothetical protein CVT99_00790 [Bacteroidetes bacterium HGW-Bacteroidetes-16]
MATQSTTSDNNLRHQAEELLRKKQSKTVSPLCDTETDKFIHELERHQIELEIHHKEPICAEKKTKEIVNEKNAELYDTSPLSVIKLSKEGEIIQINLNGARMLGKESGQLINSSFGFFVSDDSKPIFNRFIENILSGKGKESCEINLSIAGDKTTCVNLTGNACDNEEQCLITMVDMTKQKQTTDILRLYAEIVENMTEGVFVIHSSNQRVIYTNPAIEQLFGYAPHELIGKKITTVIAPTKKSPMEVARKILQSLNTSRSWTGEVRNLRKDGTTFWSYANVSTFENQQYGSVWVSIHMDITEQKRVEKLLRQSEKKLRSEVTRRTKELYNLNKLLKSELSKRKSSQKQINKSLHDIKLLYHHILKVREEERIHIARLIHDDLAQLLTTLKIELVSYKKKIGTQEVKTHRSLDNMLDLLDKCSTSVTSVITKLRPVALDKMGLIPALKQLLIDFQDQNNITCDFRIEGNSPEIDQEIAIATYTVAQEALINIRNHSKATYVSVKLLCNSSFLSIMIKDFGRGITREELTNNRSFGIIGMRERMKEIKGTISIKGIPEKGTTVKLRVPIKHVMQKISFI